MKILAFLLVMFIPQNILAAQSHKAGQNFAKEFLEGSRSASQKTELQSIPGFHTDNPYGSRLNDKNMGDQVIQELSHNEVAQTIKKTSETRESYRLDVESNPLFTNAVEAITNPEKVIEENLQEEQLSQDEISDEEIKTCEEGGNEYQRTCRRRLEITLKIDPGKTVFPQCNGHWKNKLKTRKKYCRVGCKNKIALTVPKTVTVVREEWVDDCQVLENLADQGICRYAEKQESAKPETRIIQGEPVTRDHFEETYIYACHRPVVSGCQTLKAMGCEQINSSCKTRENGVCVVWEQTYRCGSKKNQMKRCSTQKSSSPFCLTGNCVDSSYESNGELFEALSHLSILEAAQKDIQSNVSIFKGEGKKCSRNCIHFKDCCGSEKGWGMDIGLASCTGEEKELAKARKNGRCVRVGTYCAEKKIICLRKETSFCCFGSKLARLIQEQGRQQLGIGWGTPQHPQCQGLTPEQLTQLDFSKMDLQELYEDIRKNFKEKDAQDMGKSISLERVKENMNNKVGGAQ